MKWPLIYGTITLKGVQMYMNTDWFWSKKFNHWQKRNDKVYCYVTPLLFGYQAQLYITGTASLCSLEVRTSDQTKEGVSKMIAIAEEWLDKYSDGNLEKIHKDKFSIENPEGVWRKDTEKKAWWI